MIANLLPTMNSVRAVMNVSVSLMRLMRLSVPFLASFAALALLRPPVQAAALAHPAVPAARTIAYLLPIDEGYGLSDCLARGGSCAFRVANAWCKAHGRGAALSVGKIGDVTGAISRKRLTPRQISANTRHAVVVTCRI